eukprot:gene67632-92642_t
MREDDLAQRALIATLQCNDDDDVVRTDEVLYNELSVAIDADLFDKEEGYDHDIATLDWRNRAKGLFKKMFGNRMLRLAAGGHSNTLSKRLQNSACPIFESKLFGHRILWSKVKRGPASSILVWCVSTKPTVQ